MMAWVAAPRSDQAVNDQFFLALVCGEGAEMRHGVWRAVVSDGKVYSFYLTTPDSRFEESKEIFDEMVRTFKLATSG